MPVDFLIISAIIVVVCVVIAAFLYTKSRRIKKVAQEHSLHKDENFFRALVENNEGIIALLDENLQIIFRSASGEKITGWPNEEFKRIPVEHILPAMLDDVKEVYAKAKENPGKAIPLRSKLKHRNGNYIWLEGIVTNKISDPAVKGIVVNLQDVTKQKEAEEKLKKLNRLYLFISQVNQILIKATDEKTLFKEICHVAISIGKFRMAWIGLLDEETKRLVPVTHAGEESDYLSKINIISIGGSQEGMGPGGRALRDGKYIVCNDIAAAPEMAPWHDAALGRNYHSSIGLPIKKNSTTVGLFSLYADTKNFFDEEEILLLNEIAGNISFALEIFEKETLRKKAGEELLNSKRSYQTLAEISPVGIFHADASGFTTYVNPRWCEISGIPFEEALGNGWMNAVHPEDRKKVIADWDSATSAHRASVSEYRFVKPGGSIKWVLGHAIPEKDQDNKIIGYVGTATDITERKISQQEIEKILREKEAVLNRITDSMVSVNNEWCYTFLNDAALSTHPLGREQTLGKNMWDVHPQMRGTIFWDKYHEAMRTRKVIEVEDYFPPMQIWFSVKVYPSEDGLTIFYRDITEQKNAALELKRSEENYRKAQSIGKMGHWQLDLQTNLLSWSDEIYRIFDIEPQEFENRYEVFHQFIHPDDRTAFEKAQKDALLGKSKLDFVHRITTIKNDIKYVHEIGELVYNDFGEPVLFTGTAQDISEQVAIQNEIVKERNLSDSIINSLPGVFYLYNEEGRFLRWNNNFEKITLYGPDEISRMHPLDFFDTDEKGMVAKKIKKTFDEGEDSVQANFLLKTKQKIPYYFTGKSIMYEGDPCLAGVGIDFSDRMKTQEKIKETTEQLRELAAHLQNIREEERIGIARDIHDDLGQQLTAVKIGMFRLLKEAGNDAELEKKINTLIEMTGTSIESIRRISTQLRPGILDDLGLPEALKWQIEEFEKRFAIQVHAQLPDECPFLKPEITIGLFRMFQEALTNIARHAKANAVTVNFEIKETQIILSVADNGKGFEMEQIKAKRTLGLLGMQERAYMIGGNFTIQSKPGEGTEIKIIVPVNNH